MNPRVAQFVNGKWHQNCFLLFNDASEALIVDPGSDVGEIASRIEAEGARPLAILNTHAHYDHVGAVAGLMHKYAIPFFLNGEDGELLRRANLYKLIFDSREAVTVPNITHDLRDQPTCLEFGSFAVEWFPTPGHTPGSVCFRVGRALFTGDTLMPSGPGRTDLPGGNPEDLQASLAQLNLLPSNLELYAGHGPVSRLADALTFCEYPCSA